MANDDLCDDRLRANFSGISPAVLRPLAVCLLDQPVDGGGGSGHNLIAVGCYLPAFPGNLLWPGPFIP